jgi:hypothetical protein
MSGSAIKSVVLNIHPTVLDLPAQCSILNCKKINGKFGCLYCVNPGKYVIVSLADRSQHIVFVIKGVPV